LATRRTRTAVAAPREAAQLNPTCMVLRSNIKTLEDGPESIPELIVWESLLDFRGRHVGPRMTLD